MAQLEAAARSRSEADWLVGMNATRAASIRLRSAFDGAVSLGRVQTPTLALLVSREQAIRDFKPEPYWLVEASSRADESRRYAGRYLGGKRIAEDEAAKIVREVEGQQGEITKLEKKEEREQPQLLYDLTTLQRHANTLHGFCARRTLAAAQRLYEEHKAITYPRTNSRFLTGDLWPRSSRPRSSSATTQQYRKASRVRGRAREPAAGARGQRREGHRPPRPDPDALRARPLEDGRRTSSRSTTWWPSASWRSSTRTPSSSAPGSRRPWPTHVFRTSGRVLLEAGWKAVYGAEVDSGEAAEDDTGGDQMLPKLEQGEQVQTDVVESLRKETQPPRRFTEASLLGAMETAGKDIDDVELREAMKDSGIGTPATRASIIERLIAVGYIEREGRALRGHREGHAGDQAARRARADVAGAHRRLGAPARPDRARRREPRAAS